MAQDFWATFRLGDSDRSIHTVDACGVAFVAIQALLRKVGALEARVAQMERLSD
jgi:hypothetical protein